MTQTLPGWWTNLVAIQTSLQQKPIPSCSAVVNSAACGWQIRIHEGGSDHWRRRRPIPAAILGRRPAGCIHDPSCLADTLPQCSSEVRAFFPQLVAIPADDPSLPVEGQRGMVLLPLDGDAADGVTRWSARVQGITTTREVSSNAVVRIDSRAPDPKRCSSPGETSKFAGRISRQQNFLRSKTQRIWNGRPAPDRLPQRFRSYGKLC